MFPCVLWAIILANSHTQTEEDHGKHHYVSHNFVVVWSVPEEAEELEVGVGRGSPGVRGIGSRECRGLPLGPPTPKLWHGDLLLVMNARPYLGCCFTLFLFIYSLSRASYISFCISYFPVSFMSGWLAAAWPGYLPSFFLFSSSTSPAYPCTV